MVLPSPQIAIGLLLISIGIIVTFDIGTFGGGVGDANSTTTLTTSIFQSAGSGGGPGGGGPPPPGGGGGGGESP